ncbi:PAS domain-containing sensor histidine kinase [Rhizobium tumorigenes]|uniref:PAS domain-containing sensor histidine kinase n=1 Tax=Rhizobium tumorigenes TaxID=2041385 RepID=UPI00241DA054|nr:PAS domain-containing protein [Rhizobium tumorigenes]WFS03825.1 PAS domain-containing protein [Rhizobium tumorigenes]
MSFSSKAVLVSMSSSINNDGPVKALADALATERVNPVALLEAVLSASDDCIKVLDLEGHLLFMSEGGKRVMEVDDFDSLKGCPWPDFWADESNVAARNAVAIAASGRQARFTGSAKTARGNDRFWDVQVLPLVDSGGRPTQLLSISRDISEGHAAEAKVAELIAAEQEAAKAEADTLRRMLLDAPSFMCVLEGPDHVFKITNKAYLQLVGHRDLIGVPVRRAFPDVEGQGFFELLDEVYVTGEPFIGRSVSFAIQRSQDAPYEEAFLNFVYQPIFSAEGVVTGIFVEGSDVTDLKNVELALRRKDLQLELALDAVGMGVWECTVVDGHFVDIKEDERARTLLHRLADEEATFDNFTSRVHPDDRLALAESAAQALDPSGGGILDVQYRMLERPGMPSRWVHARAKTVTFDGLTKFVGTVRDVTDRKDDEARQQLVSGELQHRIKNLLAMVSAIATQTLRGDDIADRREIFNARLHVLAQAQNLLMATTFESAGIHDTLRAALAPHGGSDGRFDIDGSHFEMTPKQSLSMALTLHELATNATKYGALSNDAGRVRISWHLAKASDGRQDLNFVWQESGGPAVSEPTTKGFGSRLISRVLAADFSGDVRIIYPSGGVVCTLTAKLG